MRKLALPLAGMLTGLVIGLVMRDFLPEKTSLRSAANQTVRSPGVRARPVLTAEQAQELRADHFSALSTVAQVYELPTTFSRNEALYALAGRSDREALDILIDQALALPGYRDQLGAMQMLFRRYAELDPPAAVKRLTSSDIRSTSQLLGIVFTDWVRVDFNAAIAAANALPSPTLRRRAGDTIMYALADTDPNLLPTAAAQLDGAFGIEDYQWRAMESLAIIDPERAMREALALDNPDAKSYAINAVVRLWAERDPAAALRYAADLGDRTAAEKMIQATASLWIAHDTDVAIAALSALPASDARNKALGDAVKSLAAGSPAKAFAIWSSIPERAASRWINDVYKYWLRNDAEAAVAATLALTDGHRAKALESLATAVGAQGDMAQARDLLARLDGSAELGVTRNSLLRAMVSHRPDGSLAIALEVTHPEQRQSAVREVLAGVASRDPLAAVALLDQLDEDGRVDAARGIVMNWSADDPAAALAWVSTSVLSEDHRAISDLARKFFRVDPDRAIAAADELFGPAEAVWRGALARALVNTDPAQSAMLVSALEGQDEFDDLARDLSYQLGRVDPELAFDLTKRMTGPQRDNAMANALGLLAEKDASLALNRLGGLSGKAHARGTSAVVTEWIKTDLKAAERYVAALPAVISREAGYTALALNTPDVDDARRYVRKVSTPGTRDMVAIGVFQRISRTEGAAAAESFLDEVGISEGVRELLTTIRSNE